MKPKISSIALAGVVAAQCVLLLGMTTVHERELSGGTLIMLETRVADPRDLIRGDYLVLRYNINDVPGSKFGSVSPTKFPAGTEVYVALEPQGAFYEVAQVSSNPPPSRDGRVVLRGNVLSSWPQGAQVAYGLEQFFVREGTGNPRGKLTAQVAVPNSGRARIKQLYIDGVPYAQAMKTAKSQ